jgi:hypothetical protein
VGIDRAVEAALPLHDERSGRVELPHDTPIAGPKVGTGVRNELDHSADPHSGGDPRSQQACTCGIHAQSQSDGRLAGVPR